MVVPQLGTVTGRSCMVLNLGLLVVLLISLTLTLLYISSVYKRLSACIPNAKFISLMVVLLMLQVSTNTDHILTFTIFTSLPNTHLLLPSLPACVVFSRCLDI